MAVRIGSWGTPEFGITEAIAKLLSGGRSTDLSQSITNSYAQSPQQSQPQPMASQNFSSYAGPQPSVLGASATRTNTTRSSGGGASAPQSSGVQQQTQNINQQTDQGLELINQDYENAISGLNAQQGELQGQASTAQGAINSQFGQANTAIGEEKATRQAGIASQEQTANKTASSAIQQARDLNRQIQQRNIAQLSGLGISSSSVTEALAERLGVETARRIAGVTGSQQEVLQNLSTEKARVNDFYQKRQSDLEQEKAVRISEIQNSLVQGLNQINAAKNQAASDKAQRRQSLLSSAQNAIQQLNLQAQQFQQSLDMWNAQRSQAVADAQKFVISPTDFSGLNNYAQSVSELPQVGGFNPVPTFDYSSSANGYYPGIQYQKKPEDQVTNPFATQ